MEVLDENDDLKRQVRDSAHTSGTEIQDQENDSYKGAGSRLGDNVGLLSPGSLNPARSIF